MSILKKIAELWKDATTPIGQFPLRSEPHIVHPPTPDSPFCKRTAELYADQNNETIEIPRLEMVYSGKESKSNSTEPS